MEIEMFIVLYTAAIVLMTAGILNWRFIFKKLCCFRILLIEDYKIASGKEQDEMSSASSSVETILFPSAKKAPRRPNKAVYVFPNSREVYHHSECHHLKRRDAGTAVRLRPCMNCMDFWTD